MVACLSLVSSLMSFQAAAQDNLTESQVKSIVEGVLESNAKKAGKTDSASSLYGPRFEIIRMPDRDFTFFKFDKETGDTWEINTYKSTSSRKVGRQSSSQDVARAFTLIA